MQRFWFGPCEDKVFELIIGKGKSRNYSSHGPCIANAFYRNGFLKILIYGWFAHELSFRIPFGWSFESIIHTSLLFHIILELVGRA